MFADLQKRTEEENGKSPWRKILWEKQPYEDNHVDKTFLIGLRQNVNVVPYDYWTVVMDSAVVTQQITVVALFLLGFFYTYSQLLALPGLSAVELALLVFGYLVRVATETPASRPRARSALVAPTGRTTRTVQRSWGGKSRADDDTCQRLTRACDRSLSHGVTCQSCAVAGVGARAVEDVARRVRRVDLESRAADTDGTDQHGHHHLAHGHHTRHTPRDI